MPETERKRNALLGDVLTLRERLESVLAAGADQHLRTECLGELSDLGHLADLLKHVHAPGSIRAIAAMVDTRRQRVEGLERIHTGADATST